MMDDVAHKNSIQDALRRTYETHQMPEVIGEISLRVECVKNLDRAIDQMFIALQKLGKEELLDTYCPYFGVIWSAARTAADYLARLDGSALAGKSFLELGCGLALPSLVAARRGARVTATDHHPAVGDFLAANMALNDVHIEYAALDWKNADQFEPTESYDWIVGTDLLYDKELPALLSRFLARASSPHTKIVIGDPGRFYLHEFRSLMESHGFALLAESQLGIVDSFGEKSNLLIFTPKQV